MQVPDSENFDLLIVGGGINGAGIARDAAGRGLKVMLCEMDDLGSGTSSKSSKFIHGGLRYLEQFKFGLVRKALVEREIILGIAPHLVRSLRLVLPVVKGMRPEWLLRLGLQLYDNLGGRTRVPASSTIRLDRDPAGAVLSPEFDRALAYWDVWIDDARLVVLNALDAAQRGARICTRTRMLSAARRNGMWSVVILDRATGRQRTVTARALVNATGPWVEKTLAAMAGVNSGRRVRLVKGSHLVLRKWWEGDCGFVLQVPDRRIVFVTPYYGAHAMAGTTDVPFENDPASVEIDHDEISYLLRVLNRSFRREFAEADILDCYSGVRPLFDDDQSKGASTVTRDYQLEIDGGHDAAPAATAFGGKLTTYRKLAEDMMNRLKPGFPQLTGPWTAGVPLPGGDMPGADFAGWLQGFKESHPWLPDQLAEQFARRYGTLATQVIGGADSLEDLGAPIANSLYPAEAEWNLEREWARTAADILERRSKGCLEFSPADRERLETWVRDSGRWRQ